MFKSLLKITFRNFRKQLGFSLLNILGLTIGLASFILVALWVQDELSIDQFHENVSDIYRINKEYKIGAKTEQNPRTPYLLGPYLEENLGQVLASVRVLEFSGTVEYQEKSFTENKVTLTETSFFQVYNFPLLQGDKANCLNEKNSIVITQKIAKKYFGDKNPIGEELRYRNRPFKVTAVAADLPENTYFSGELFVSLEYFESIFPSILEWGNHYMMTYILTSGIEDIDVFDKEITRLLQMNVNNQNLHLKCQKFSQVHFQGADTHKNGYQYVILFAAIGLFVLIMACINYTNMSTAQAAYRSKEIGIKKVFGASKASIRLQVLSESIFYSLVSIILAMMLAELMRPFFNHITNKNLEFSYINPYFIISLSLLTFLTGLIAGIYPAFILTRLNPIVVLKGIFTTSQKAILFRKILVIFQFSIGIVLIISTLVVFLQLNYMSKKDLGFNKENVVYFDLATNIADDFELFKNDLLSNPSVLKVCGSSQLPNEIWSIVRDVRVEGMKSDEGVSFGYNTITYDFLDLLELDIIEGRDFSKEFSTDSTNFIFNKNAIDFIGFEDPINKRFRLSEEREGHIIGVVEDFNFLPLTYDYEPLILILEKTPILALVKIDENSIDKALAHIEKTWKTYNQKEVLEYGFLEDRIAESYNNEQNMGGLSLILSVIAIIIECLGLLGLVSFLILKKNKEVGVRKVLGSSISSIIGLFLKDFIIWVLIANAIAWPIAWIISKNWLENFAFGIELNLGIFAVAGLITLFIAVLTISVQVYRAASRNPVESIKYE